MNSIALEQKLESLASRAVLHDRIGLPAIHFKRQRNSARPRTQMRRAQSKRSLRKIGAARRRPFLRASYAGCERQHKARPQHGEAEIE